MIAAPLQQKAVHQEGYDLAPPPGTAHRDELDAVVAAVAEGAPAWFPELAGETPQVHPAAAAGRARGSLRRIDVTWPGGRRSVVAKTTSLHAPTETLEDRPRLGDVSDYQQRHALEFATLSRVHEHFATVGDPRLGTIRPLVHLPEQRTFVMDHVGGRTLREHSTPRAAWGPRTRQTTTRLYRGAGAWMRAFHALSPPPPPVRRGTAADFRAALDAYLAFLQPHGAAEQLRPLADLAAATFSLAGTPKLVVGHADCAPRNFLLTPDRRVVGFDVLGKWAVPREEDLAYFLLSLRLSAPRAMSLGLAYPVGSIEQWAQAFLTGYGDEGMDVQRLHAYGVLLLLDHLAAAATRHPAGLRGRVQPAVDVVMRAALRREARRLHRALS